MRSSKANIVYFDVNEPNEFQFPLSLQCLSTGDSEESNDERTVVFMFNFLHIEGV